jgi:hypothetical protein
MFKNKNDRPGPCPACRRSQILRTFPNNVKRPTPVFLNLDWATNCPAHAPATSAFRNGDKVNCQRHFSHSALLLKGLHLLAGRL